MSAFLRLERDLVCACNWVRLLLYPISQSDGVPAWHCDNRATSAMFHLKQWPTSPRQLRLLLFQTTYACTAKISKIAEKKKFLCTVWANFRRLFVLFVSSAASVCLCACLCIIRPLGLSTGCAFMSLSWALLWQKGAALCSLLTPSDCVPLVGLNVNYLETGSSLYIVFSPLWIHLLEFNQQIQAHSKTSTLNTALFLNVSLIIPQIHQVKS